MASSDLHFPSEDSHVHKHKNEFVYFSTINLSYVSLILLRPVTRPKKVGGNSLLHTYFFLIL